MAMLGHQVVLFGGNNGRGNDGNSGLNNTWTFDGTNWTPVSVSNDPPERNYAPMATLGNQLVLFGGNELGYPLVDT